MTERSDALEFEPANRNSRKVGQTGPPPQSDNQEYDLFATRRRRVGKICQSILVTFGDVPAIDSLLRKLASTSSAHHYMFLESFRWL
jgi:hypothetical protein